MKEEERHFISMCGHAGLVHGAKLDHDKSKAEQRIKSRYKDPVYQAGYQKIIEDRGWKEANKLCDIEEKGDMRRNALRKAE
jgi:hypothetical protein